MEKNKRFFILPSEDIIKIIDVGTDRDRAKYIDILHEKSGKVLRKSVGAFQMLQLQELR